MVCYQKLPSYSFINIQQIRYGWYGIRNCHSINHQATQTKVRMEWYQILLPFNITKKKKIVKIRYRWCDIRNYHPYNFIETPKIR